MRTHDCQKILGITLVACCFLVISSLLGTRTDAQLAGATLSGVVSDSSGAPVAGANVSIKNLATGVVRDVSANTDGVFAAANLAPGDYEVTVAAKGFSTFVQKNLTLTVGAEQALNVTLKVGQLSERVEVQSAPPTVETTSSIVSATVEQKTVEDLPLNGRDWTQLATLQPGVISIRAQASTSSTANRGNRGFGDQLADSGHRPNENTYRIDGISINDYSNGAPGSVLGASLGVDAVQEFSVVTTGYTAEYGRTSGAVINAITKSGTNQFHGSGYFFDRDKIFDARNFFDGPKVPPFRRTQFGGSAGGPIVKDNTWIFGDYEAVRQSQTLTFGKQLVPSDAARAGNLCSAPSSSACTPHSVTVDPKVVPFLKLWPAANGGIAPGSNGDVGFLNTGGLKVLNENYFTVKADHKLSSEDTLSGSYFFDTAPQTNPDSLDNVIHQVFTRRQMVGLTENHIFGPALANVFRLGFSRVVGLVNSPVKAINPAAGDTSLGTLPGLDAPLIEVSGLTNAGGLGDLSFFGHHWNSYQVYDDLFRTKGKHTLNFGFAFERMQYDVLSKVRGNGDWRFRTLNALPGVSALENFLTNRPTSLLLLSPTIRKEVGSRDSLFGGYIQDDWRAKSNLTLNIGLRYEMLTNPTEAHNGFGALQNFFTSASTTPISHQFASNPTLRNFDPRIGFSWDPFHSGRTAVRGGFGIFSVLPLPYVYTIGDSLTLPFSLQTNAGSSANPLPAGSFPNNLSGINFSNSAGSRFVERDPHRSYSMNWNFNVQRDITSKVSAMVGYVGSHVIHEPFTTDDSNQVVATLTNGVYVWPTPVGSGTIANPNVGFIRPVFFDASSEYGGLQTQVRYKVASSFQVQGSYTYGKCYSDGDGAQLGDPYQNSLASLIFFDKAHRHGPCDFDIRQNLSVNYLYSFPGPGNDSAARWIAGGWQVGGIITASTGVPFTLLINGDPLGQNSSDAGYDYPSRVSGCNPIAGAVAYLNLNCFVLPGPPSGFSGPCQPFVNSSGNPMANTCQNLLGNNGRNQLYGPKLVDFDFSVFKNTHVPKISESFNIQFRAEFFNILNHTNLQAPVDNNVILNPNGTFVGGAGVIDSTATASRQIQLGIKLIW